MNKKRVFLTGSGGFIARNIIEQLGDKYFFVAPSHKDLDLLDLQSVDKFFKKNKFFDYVIHTANVGGNRKISDTPDIAVSNLKMFFNVERNRKHFGRMLHLGSGIEYAKERHLKRVRESDFGKFVPEDNFGFYKYLCGKYIESSEHITNFRIFGIFGKWEDFSIRFISNAICKSVLGMPITIHQNVYFDYLHIDDFVKITDHFLNHKMKHKSYNVGAGKRIDLVTLAQKINGFSKTKSKIKVAVSGLLNEYTCDNKRLINELGNFKFSDIDDSIEDLYKWYLSRKKFLRKKDFLNDYFN